MTVHAPTRFPVRHIDRLPRSFVRGLAATVLSMHGILIAIALGNMPLVETSGHTGDGSGNGGGNKALFVSVLPGTPALSGFSAERQIAHSAEKPAAVKRKKQPELIATTAVTPKTSPGEQTIGKAPFKPAKPAAADSGTIPDTPFSSVRQTPPDQLANVADSTGATHGTGNGTGKGHAEGKSTVTGAGEGTGSGIGSGGTGNGIARSVSLSRLRYKRAVKPEYPARSIQRHESGQVNVRVVVDTAGHVHDARVVVSSGFSRLDEAALKAARRSTFYPYTEHGRPLFAAAVIPYRFNLNGK